MGCGAVTGLRRRLPRRRWYLPVPPPPPPLPEDAQQAILELLSELSYRMIFAERQRRPYFDYEAAVLEDLRNTLDEDGATFILGPARV